MSPNDLASKFWNSLGSHGVMMVGLAHAQAAQPRPMTAQVLGGQPPIWFFTSKDNAMVRNLCLDQHATAIYVSKNHDLFASLRGRLILNPDRAMIERLWGPFVAAWYPGGKDDPNLALLRLEPEEAEIWSNEASLWKSMKLLLGADPRRAFSESVAKVRLEPPRAGSDHAR
jgi:general stress protein 26